MRSYLETLVCALIQLPRRDNEDSGDKTNETPRLIHPSMGTADIMKYDEAKKYETLKLEKSNHLLNRLDATCNPNKTGNLTIVVRG